MTKDRYMRACNMLTTLRRLAEARETIYQASISCQYHGLRTVGGVSYRQKVQDRLDSLDHLIGEIVEDIERQCEYEEEERQDGVCILPLDPGHDRQA